MPLFIKDPEVDRVAQHLARVRHVSKTEVVREALRRELEREEGKADLVAIGLAFAKTLRAQGDPARAAPAAKASVDAMYEAG